MKDKNISTSFSFVADFDGDIEKLSDIKIDGPLPVLPLRNMVLFPGVMTPITVNRNSSMKVIQKAERNNSLIAVFCQRSPEVENPTELDLHTTGVAARVVRVLDLPDSNRSVILQGLGLIQLNQIVSNRPYLIADVSSSSELYPFESEQTKFDLLMEDVRQRSAKLIEMSESLPSEANFAIKNLTNDVFLVNFICTSFPFSTSKKIELLRTRIITERTIKLLKALNTEIQLEQLRIDLQQKTQQDLNDQQREYFLQQQLKNIQSELGNGADSIKDSENLRQAAREMKWPHAVKETFMKELNKLERYHPQSPDYNIQLTYLQTILQLPWWKYTKDHLNLKSAERILNQDHYGMEKVKERILEHLAVLQLRGDLKSPIICLYGPPGVGKTSLGKSIAKSLNRQYVRMSLGGLHDEAEIRGHRRTYIGAMPGRIIKNIIKAGSSNPVFILDEIDKISQTTAHGDPSSALLEVLDPEQNNAFHDNYLDIDYDLSKVMFIATANNISTIPQPLLDRMELIEVSGYITEEKIEIARKHLVPKEKENNGLQKHKDLKLSKAAIEMLIEKYTRESGVRGLEKQIGKVFRKLALNYARTKEFTSTTILPDMVKELLGKPPYSRDIYQGNETAGVVTGLAWTSVGGEILFIETSLSKGKGSKLTLTGNLGDVMKESAVLALEYIKAHSEILNLDHRIFDNWNIHVHVPEGAVPKDGPSAGITMVTSLASALTQRKVRSHIAMTGEITLRGKVLPVGGIKEKILAAKRAGITDIIMCQENRKDIEEIPEIYLKGVSFHYVEHVGQVLDYALLDEKVDNAIELTIDEEKNDK